MYEDLQKAAATIAESTNRDRHDVVAVLGSGLGSYPEAIPDARSVSYRDLPGFPVPHIEGHAGRLYSAQFGPNNVLLLSGRTHSYEGQPLEMVVFAVRACLLAGCHTLLVTNAAGGCGPDSEAGDLVLITDHINLTGRNPLVGANDERLGPRFPDMTDTYTADLRQLAKEVGAEIDVHLKEGVYAWFQGPSYETPAEVRMAQTLGAHLVGMSTVPEAIAARHMGAHIIGISLVTNLAAGISPTPLSHQEVQEAATAAQDRFRRLLDNLLPRL